MSISLREKDIETLRAVFLHFPLIQTVHIFGSRARGTARRASDIDLAVTAPGMSSREWSEMQAALEEAPLIYHLDVVRCDTLTDEKLRSRIVAEGEEVFRGPTNSSHQCTTPDAWSSRRHSLGLR